MSLATMSLIGLYNYDNTIFNNLQLPAGIDRDVLIYNILLRSGAFEVLYPDPDFLRDAIGVWSRKWQRTFTKWQEALEIKYDPLYNYDRHEEWTTDESGTNKTEAEDESSVDGTVTNKVSAFNSSTFENDSQGITDSGSSSSSTVDGQHTRNEIRKGRAYGNIGVTTSQQMLQSELDIAAWNLYEHIADLFCAEFVIPVY